MLNYKETLNICQSAFEMKANLFTKEPKIQDFWLSHDIYQKLLDQNKNNQQWVLHDGPPYANGNIHIGHALNKILKDFVIRYHLMKGDYSPFILGWDTHGLPIEHALLKKNPEQAKLSVVQQREACKEFAIKNVQNQLQQFQRLGLVTNFKDIYLTLNPEFEINQLKLFSKMVDKKLVYQDYKPVYWSWSSHSALAEAEIEYDNKESDSIFVNFIVVKDKGNIKSGDQLVIWTTTPWTIPSNLAIAVNPLFEYARIKYENKVYIVAKNLLEKFIKSVNWSNFEIVNTFLGKDLELVEYFNPLTKEINPVILADYVSDEDGTGLVHNAPGFGLDDYYACKKYNINVYCPIDEYGKFTSDVKIPELNGIFYEKANDIIINLLANSNALIHKSKFIHSVAIDWRTKKPIIYRATKQWFVNIEQIQNDLIDTLNDVEFLNQSNKIQLTNMIANRKEWCISRQRVWGVPIPIIFDENNQPIFDHELIENIIDVLKLKGTNAWFSEPVESFLTNKYLTSKSNYRKEKDIMDVWFDSGSSYNILLDKKIHIPCHLYLEGSDQYRGWFNSSLICSYIQNNTAPYKKLISHGFTLDEHGRKMSKSLGNVIDPLDICNSLGADVLRIWVASTNYFDDVRISKNILNQVVEIYRRIRNSLLKFISSNLSDFDFAKDKCLDFSKADLYILDQLKTNVAKILTAYEKFDFSFIIKTINLHTIELSSWYFNLIKDSLYCDSINDKNRRSIQTVLYLILCTYLALLAPIIPHTCEECYQSLNLGEKSESIFLDKKLIKYIDCVDSIEIDKNYWSFFFKLKDTIYLKLEELRKKQIISKSNEALVEIKFNKQKFNFSEQQLKEYLNVAKVIINDDEKLNQEFIIIDVKNAKMKRCERCWNFFEQNELDENSLCSRCHNILNNK